MSLFELCDDILELIEIELRPRLKYNQVVSVLSPSATA